MSKEPKAKKNRKAIVLWRPKGKGKFTMRQLRAAVRAVREAREST